jgi:hypothetical protein
MPSHSCLTYADKQDDDPFFSEVSAFIDAIEGGPDPHILSSFEDATKTYEYVSLNCSSSKLTDRLTWAIRLAAEASRAPRVKA